MCDFCLNYRCPPSCPQHIHIKIGQCEVCKIDIYDTDSRLIDEDENLFCDEECALKYHKVKRVE